MNVRLVRRIVLAFASLVLVAGAIGDLGPAQVRSVRSDTRDLVSVADVTAETPHPILSDLRVRQAIAYCINRSALVGAVYPFLNTAQRQSLTMDTFLPRNHWAYNNLAMKYPYNPTLGMQLLDAAGWRLHPGDIYRRNAAGQELALTLTATTATIRQTYAALLETQLRTCGIRLVRSHVPTTWFFGAGPASSAVTLNWAHTPGGQRQAMSILRTYTPVTEYPA